MLNNPNFYPTPKELLIKMTSKVQKWWEIKNILEPSAGSGTIIDYLRRSGELRNSYVNISAIEIDPELQAILRGKDIKLLKSQGDLPYEWKGAEADLIDSDFLKYNGQEHFDLIIANFPFSDGDAHLLKAIDIMFSGQIVCLLNAETIKNPYSNRRRLLVSKLEELNAEIEYIEDAFLDAERKTPVEVALIYINVDREVETHLYEGMKKDEEMEIEGLEEKKEVATRDGIKNLVINFNRERETVINQIVDFYKNYYLVSKHLSLKVNSSEEDQNQRGKNLTEIMKAKINTFLRELKKSYWQQVTKLPEVKRKLTSKKREEFRAEIEKYQYMEFSESNIRQFVINLIERFPKMIDETIEKLFDDFTSYALRDNSWGDEEYKKNIHYFNAWKTNNGFKINKKVIMPFYLDMRWSGFKIDFQKEDFLNDVDLVISYFSTEPQKESLYETCKQALEEGQNRKIDSKFFEISIFKKGTIHFLFKDEDILRRFNIEACKMKKFLPMDYAEREFSDLCESEKDLVRNFEGAKEYKTVGHALPVLEGLNENSLPLLEYAS